MTGTEIAVFSSVAGGILLFGAVVSLIFWARISALEDRAEPKALLEARTLAESTADRVDTTCAEMRKFRESVHAEMQRFYGIMRRNETAVEKVEAEQHPDRIPAEEVHGAAEPTDGMTRKELRELARSKGKRI